MSVGKGQDVIEVTLKINSSDIGNIEVLKGLLMGIGVDKNLIVECEEWPETCLSIYFNSQAVAHALQKKLRGFHLRHVSVTLKRLLKKDWQTKWKRDFKPFALTKTLGVVPMWLKGAHRIRGRIPVYIDTNVAFGTGLHATTRFMAQFVERCKGRYKSFIDIGTGTGILAIIASKCGADDIAAMDISPEAVEIAKMNFMENECASIRIKVANAQRIKIKKQYDFVCANIITQDLIMMAAKIFALVKPGKYLAVSGISLNSYDVFRQAYTQYPLRCLKIEKGEGWVAILYKKKQ